jgi:hypothetical protein
LFPDVFPGVTVDFKPLDTGVPGSAVGGVVVVPNVASGVVVAGVRRWLPEQSTLARSAPTLTPQT